MKRRIGLYGGTFDPVHSGHIEIARGVSKFFELDLLLFIPAQIAPHKVGWKVTAPIHRYTMLALATEEDSGLRISTYEIEGPDRRYTVDTLRHFKEVFTDTDLFFIMGADSWEEINTWRDWENLLTMTNHIVVTRPGYEIDSVKIGSPLRERVVDVRGKTFDHSDSEPRIFFTDVVNRHVSATEIRRAAAESSAETLSTLVPERVATYIRKYGLYRNTNETEFYS